MNKLYTAVGRLQAGGSIGGKKCPMVVVNHREYILDIQEMMLWTILNWRILDEEEALALYEAKEQEVGYQSHRDYYDCLHRQIGRASCRERV